jgi:hypothetical protein
MTESEALVRMVAPGQVRPGKMGGHGGVIQIHLTRACTRACFGCTQGSNLGGKAGFMSLENFEAAVRSLEGYFGIVALFGGQPTLHPQFDSVCTILRQHVPLERRGLWTNALNGHGAECRRTFLPKNCNLNVHMSAADHAEFRRDWPEAMPFGLRDDSRHGPPFVAMKDVVPDESERWELIAGCDINQHWSAMMGEFRGEVRAWFCELAGAQSIIHQDEPDYPDTGVSWDAGDREVCWIRHEDQNVGKLCVRGPWWKMDMAAFRFQVRKHCHDCGIPLRGYGELACAAEDAGKEQVSETHQAVFKPKRKGRAVELVTVREQLGPRLEKSTAYLQNAKR